MKPIISKFFRGILCLSMFFILSGCDSEENVQSSTDSESVTVESNSEIDITIHSDSAKEIFLTKNITGLSGKIYQLSIPSNWIEETNPKIHNEDFEFMISDKGEDQFVGCITENKDDFVDLDAYTKLAKKNLDKTTSETVTFTKKTVSGKQINIAEIHAVIDGMKISYIYHIVETKTSYVQLYGWTLTRLFESSHERLDTILNSFVEK